MMFNDDGVGAAMSAAQTRDMAQKALDQARALSHPAPLFWINNQQAFALSAIACLDDTGADVHVTLLNGREYRVPDSRRPELLDALRAAR